MQKAEGKHCYVGFADDLAMHIGHTIRTVMKRTGVRSKDIAKACEVTPGGVSNWLRTGSLSKENLSTVADLLKTPLRDLISGAAAERDYVAPGDQTVDEVLSSTEYDLLLEFREMSSEDRQWLTAEAANRSERFKRLSAEVLSKFWAGGNANAQNVRKALPPAPSATERRADSKVLRRTTASQHEPPARPNKSKR